MPSSHAGAPWARRLLVFVVALGCGGGKDDGITDPGPGKPVPVASLTIVGAPTAPVLVGATMQLVATPRDAQGAPLADRPVTWRSSDTLVARVSDAGLVSAVAVGRATVTSASEGKEAGANVDVRVGGTLDPQGGSIAVFGGAVAIVVPAGAFTQLATITVAPAAAPADPRLLGGAYELGPDTLTLAKPAALALKYDPAVLPPGVLETSLQLYTLSLGAWTVVPGSAADPATKTVSGSISRTGTYAVLATLVERVVVTGAPPSGQLYVGETAQLAAAVYDAANNLLPRSVTWASSDPGRLRVTETGKLSAFATGSFTITATREGKSATVPLTVLPDTSTAVEWTTFQGNPSHTGYVPLTLDPATFRQAWVADVAPGAALNPVTVGGRHVFVSTTAYFGKQILATLDVATGAQRWSRDFGDIHSVDPPAYSNGKVYVQTGGHEDSFLWAFDADAGTVIFRSSYENQWSRYYAPTIVGDRLYTAGGYYGGMYAFSTIDGSRAWFSATNQYDQWTPAVRDGLVYAYTGSYSPKVSVVDAATGATVYEIADPRFDWRGWSMGTAPVLGSANNLLAIQSSRLISFDLQGRKIGWELSGTYGGTVTVAGGVLYVFNNRQVEARSESDGALLWVWIPPEGQPVNTMVATKNLLFVSTAANTYAIDLGSHAKVWSYAAGGHLALSKQGILFIAQTSGKLAAITVK